MSDWVLVLENQVIIRSWSHSVDDWLWHIIESFFSDFLPVFNLRLTGSRLGNGLTCQVPWDCTTDTWLWCALVFLESYRSLVTLVSLICGIVDWLLFRLKRPLFRKESFLLVKNWLWYILIFEDVRRKVRLLCLGKGKHWLFLLALSELWWFETDLWCLNWLRC